MWKRSRSLMSAGKEFQVDEAATEKARQASTVCVRERRAAERRMNEEPELVRGSVPGH